MDSEKRTVGELRQIGSLIVSVCDLMQFRIENCEKAKLAAGYWKSRVMKRDDLAAKCLAQLMNSKNGPNFLSIDDMEIEGLITSRDAAFLRNYLNE